MSALRRDSAPFSLAERIGSSYVTINQTVNGDYLSFPKPQDVLSELQGGTGDWAREYADRGHGEYVENVKAVVEFCRQYGISSPEDVQTVLSEYTKTDDA